MAINKFPTCLLWLVKMYIFIFGCKLWQIYQWVTAWCLEGMEVVQVTEFVVCVIHLAVGQTLAGNERLWFTESFGTISLFWYIGTPGRGEKVKVRSRAASLSTFRPHVWGRTSRGKIRNKGGAPRIAAGAEAGVRGGWGVLRRPRLVEIKFGDQRFSHGYWLPFFYLFIHVGISVLKADGECELFLSR